MNKKILRQALHFINKNQPIYSKIKELYLLASKYEQENEVYFLYAKRREKSKIIDEKLFFQFLSDEIVKSKNIYTFEDIKNILNANSRAENIKYSGDSKTNHIKIFDKIVLIKEVGECPKLYQLQDLYHFKNIDSFVVVENGESFLNIDKLSHLFNEKYFVYISGNGNSLTRDFLEDKKLTFFIDYDIESMNIFENFNCKEKRLFIHKDIEYFFKNDDNRNVALYQKQRKNLKDSYSKEVMPIIKLIKKHNIVIEQEIIHYEAH